MCPPSASSPATADQTPVNVPSTESTKECLDSPHTSSRISHLAQLPSSNVSSPGAHVRAASNISRVPTPGQLTISESAPLSHWRCDSIPADDEDDKLSEFRLLLQTPESAPSRARSEAIHVVAKMLAAISQLLTARQIDFSKLLSALATLHGTLQCLLISKETAGVALNNSLNKTFREFLGELTQRCTAPLKVNVFLLWRV
eukprot:Gregarina_sp_Poly_1__2528@NODE_1686_length_3535_cov_246_940311_g1108_i0_p2_GENE_NODE_1686_length_3535_cov_246_940311_g1108_i0NODE_1686_length_3535_cov_246_940311_g1108_i0_p2_ORF_typecomplete_len201_score35_81Ku_PK_bind/PF08785_11/0_13_NODE_1686_length_3535_cov_246_940311_g1108_i027763378